MPARRLMSLIDPEEALSTPILPPCSCPSAIPEGTCRRLSGVFVAGQVD